MTITLSGDGAQTLQRISTGVAKRRMLHATIAARSEDFVKEFGRMTADSQHQSAQKLGAQPTKHLQRAYASTESGYNDTGAELRFPRASRLRAAFGDYIVRPGSGKKFLTIPASKEAYGRRAGEFENLVFVRWGYRQVPALARKVPGNTQKLELMYFLTKSSHIKEDRNLIPFDALGEEAADATTEFLLTMARSKGGAQ